MDPIVLALIAVGGFALGGIVIYLVLQVAGRGALRRAHDEAENVVGDARREARELTLVAEKEALERRDAAEQEAREARREVTRSERRMEQREEALERRGEKLEATVARWLWVEFSFSSIFCQLRIIHSRSINI